MPSEEFRFELMAAVKRGVDVRMLTNSRETHDNWPVADASRRLYDELLAAGVNIEERHHSTLHAKTATFDGEYSIVGSANLNGRWRNQDTEVVLGIDGRRAAGELENRYNTRDHTSRYREESSRPRVPRCKRARPSSRPSTGCSDPRGLVRTDRSLRRVSLVTGSCLTR